VVKVEKHVVNGAPDVRRITTSHMEKQNHTLRMHCRRLTGLTNAFSKMKENFETAVALNFAYYRAWPSACHRSAQCGQGVYCDGGKKEMNNPERNLGLISLELLAVAVHLRDAEFVMSPIAESNETVRTALTYIKNSRLKLESLTQEIRDKDSN
jgi:hypothetical protein